MRTCRSNWSSVPRSPFAVPALLTTFLLAAACSKVAPLLERSRASSAHERYADALRDAGLDKTALGRDWLAAASASSRTPLTVALPFREAGYFAASEARAVAYAMSLRDGQRVWATAETSGTPMLVFLDLFRQTTDTASTLDLVASTDTGLTSGGARLNYVVKRDGIYVLRVQPELLRSGAFTLRLDRALAGVPGIRPRQPRNPESLRGGARRRGARASRDRHLCPAGNARARRRSRRRSLDRAQQPRRQRRVAIRSGAWANAVLRASRSTQRRRGPGGERR